MIYWGDARHSLHVAPLTDVYTPLHAPSDWSTVFHFVAPLTDTRIPLHVPSNWSAVFHFVASLTDMHAPLHAPSNRSAVSVCHFIAPLTDMRTPLHAPSDRSAVFHLSLRWLAFTPFTCSCCWLTPFLFLTRIWHCLCCCRNGSCSFNRHDTNPPWYKLKDSCCTEGMPKRFCNHYTMVWIFVRCKTQIWTFMCGRLPGKRIVCSASKVTTCSSVYQTCHFISIPNMPSCCQWYALPARWQHGNHVSIMSCYCYW